MYLAHHLEFQSQDLLLHKLQLKTQEHKGKKEKGIVYESNAFFFSYSKATFLILAPQVA